MRILNTFLLALILVLSSCSQDDKVQIIFDTDIGGDGDDLAALAMLHHFINQGECELRAVMCWSTESHAVSAIDAVNRWYAHPDIPIGLRKEGSYEAGWMYNAVLAKQFEHVLEPADVPDATELYRKILSENPDHSLTLVTVGPLKNILNVMESGPDQYSDLDGLSLMEKKISEMVIMGGQFPSGDNEWNFNGNMPGVTRKVLEGLDLPITFSGFEVGLVVKTGAFLNQEDPRSPLHVGFLHFSEHAPWIKNAFEGEILNNASYDQTAVLYAVRKEEGGYWTRVIEGYCEADDNGGNRWIEGEHKNHSYLQLTRKPEELARLIEELMQ